MIDNPYLATYFLTSTYYDGFAMGALLNFLPIRPRPWQLLAVLAFTLAAGVAVSGWGIRPYVPGGDLLNFGWPMSLPAHGQSVAGHGSIALEAAPC